MAQDLTKLASQGRAYSAARPWTEEELELLIAIEKHAEGIQRPVAADFIRNGITSIEEYDAAVKADFVPSDQATLQAEAVKAHTKKVREELGLKTEEVSETKEVPEPAKTAEVSETEEVTETKGSKKKAVKKNIADNK